MISSKALGVVGRVGSRGLGRRLACRLDVVRPSRVLPIRPPFPVPTPSVLPAPGMRAFSMELAEKVSLLEANMKTMRELLDMKNKAQDTNMELLEAKDKAQDAYMKTTVELQETRNREQETKNREQETKNRAHEIEIEDLHSQMRTQTFLHMEWCQRDLSVVAAEVLKWSIGAKTASDGDGRHLYNTSKLHEVEIGARVFNRTVADYKDFSRLVILERNHQVHFGSLKVLDARVETAHFYIKMFGAYLRVSKPKEVEVVENYSTLKEALPSQFK